MSLFGMLGSASRALDVQRFGLDVVGNNLANINTPGYTRRVADLGTVAPHDRFSAGNGAQVLGVRSLRDRLFDQRLFDEAPMERKQAALADTLGLAEVALGTPGSSLDSDLAQFFDAFAQLADAPTSPTARQQVLSEGAGLAAAFNGMSSRLTDAANAADARVRQDVIQINQLTDRIAVLNKAIGSAPTSQTLHLRDEQMEAIKELSGIIGTQVIELADGTMQVQTRTGRPLVVGNDAYAVEAVSTPPYGYARIQAAGVDITAEITDGRVAGAIQARDQSIPAYMAQLDQIAYDVANAVNALHTTGYDKNGAVGGNFFTTPATVAGAAASLSLDAAIAGHPERIAAAGVAVAGDNVIARQLADLRDAAIVGGQTPDQAWSGLAYTVGRDVNRARVEQANRADILEQIEQLRDSVSGVSIDEEAAMMLRFQRAYQANAQFFTVIDETITTLLSIKR